MRLRLWGWAAAAVAVIDQVTKAVVVARLAVGESLPVWPPWFHITHVRNTGAAFGLFQSHPSLLTAVGFAVLVAAFWFRRHIDEQPPAKRLAVGLGVGGALGNALDRLWRGAVVDFIDWRVWPVFNMADTAIVVAALLLVWSMIRADHQPEASA